MNRIRIVAALMPVMLMMAVGCDDEEKYTLRFNHALHIEDVGMACVDCHGEMTASGGWQRPDHETCVGCHDDLIEGDVSEETCGVCHVETLDEIGELAGAKNEASRGVFVHTVSLEGRCTDCHRSVLDPKHEHVVAHDRADYVMLRDMLHSRNEPCWTCHESLTPSVVPESHNANWKRQHGTFFKADEGLCQSCHMEDTCQECHQQEKPSSHTNLFRTRTHGIEASWNRETCQTCHQDDFCTACHSTVKPRSHNARWQDRHCFQCHSSQGSGSGCETCHAGGIEVHANLAQPPWHANMTLSCFTAGCHGPANGGFARLIPSRHPFLDETECISCHRL